MNRSLIVRILKQKGVCSRAELAEITGLTQAAITKIVAVLLEIGIVSEVGFINGRCNRRSIGLALNVDSFQVVGIKFARREFAVGVFDISGKPFEYKFTKYDANASPEDVISQIKSQTSKYIDRYDHIVAIGLAVPGPFLRREGVLPILSTMPQWDNTNFREKFRDAFDKPLYIEHDANSGVLAQWWFSLQLNSPRDIAFLLLGDGVGAGIIESGRLLRGSHGILGEIGHVSIDYDGIPCECGGRGCLERYCCVSAIETSARTAASKDKKSLLNDNEITLENTFDCARAGDAAALDVVRRAAEYIGYGCVMIFNAYDPEIIYIGERVANGWDLMEGTICDVIRKRIPPVLRDRVQIRKTDLSMDPILLGAAALATDEVLKLPTAFSPCVNSADRRDDAPAAGSVYDNPVQ
jgi:predicted NBD/HSP70 family sugar kinase